MTGLFLILIFIILAGFMYSGKLPALLALPILAFLITLAAGIPFYYLKCPAEMNTFLKLGHALIDAQRLMFNTVVTEGVMRLHVAILTVMLGGIFAYFLKTTGTSETLVRKVAELAGDKPFVISLVLTLVVAFLFTTLGGLGAIILVANIYFPVLLSLSVPPLLIACMFLMALSFGGVFNMVNWALYTDILKLSQDKIMSFALPLGGIFFLVFIAFIIVEFKRAKLDVPLSSVLKVFSFILIVCGLIFAVKTGGIITPVIASNLKIFYKVILFTAFILPLFSRRFSWVPMLAPFVPISLVLFSGWNIIPAFVCGILFLFITTLERRKSDSLATRSKMLIQSSIEGIAGVTPAIAVMIGIGMVLIAVTQPAVSQSLTPILTKIIPSTSLGFVVLFSLLAPLALYRGPLNLWGMGSGLMGLLSGGSLMAPFLIMSAFMSTGQIQGVCDPTNTHNVWVANQLKIDLNAILRKTLPYMWVIVVAGLVVSVWL